MNYRMPYVLFRYILALSIVFRFIFLQVLADECVLDLIIPSSWNDSKRVGKNWGGFLKNPSCGLTFERYLYALATNANKTGEIFLNTTEQKICLSTLNTTEKDDFGCGIERLTSGTGGCSDYSVENVVTDQLRSAFQNLDEDCRNLGSNFESDEECNSCLERWKQMSAGSANTSNGLNGEEIDVCRFSVLISLTSRRINETGWIESIYTCLGNGISLGLEVLVGACGNSFSEKSSSVKISLREVKLATNNLSELNYIGQGVAGKVYKGILSNGQHIAVKHIINDGYMETFVREVTSLSHVKHPNLVELLGHCDGEDESFLVYELCHNGNLSEWLFGFLHGSKDLKLQLTVPEDYGFFIHIQKAALSIGILSLQTSFLAPTLKPNYLTSDYQKLFAWDFPMTEDTKLGGDYSVEAFQMIFKLALSCTGLKQQRPSMEKVVAVLEKAHRISETVMSLDSSF
ncbi:hypothetical protein DH2020_003568 [Rehmannia glutinosa]|uniref:non-specific serine/threonine protein kinase n=1 Tax=Rehmannia glutinosa TaxID=99300 RepID=A0ABR0XLY1_REHGL